ncbi:MAG TPA: MFS transporter [Acidimicrobiales bacterium]|nr:MFS transporter [Acidimicrobiales bacterium]
MSDLHGGAAPRGHGVSVDDLLDDAPTSRFHRKAVLVSGVGFFTDAYDLFVIGTVAALVTTQWHLSTAETSWVSGSAILGAFVGALVFGRIADLLGRKRVYAMVAAIMIVGAVASAVAPGFAVLVGARFLLGLGIGGDYPVSAVLMSEYANRADRGRLVGLVFSMQALGLVVGPLVALALLGLGVGGDATWRILLGLGAVPAAGVLYVRARMPESPRFTAHVRGDAGRAAADVASFSAGALPAREVRSAPARRGRARDLVTDPRLLRLALGTAASWFLFDYAYYGNTLSLPVILSKVDTHASLVAKLVWTLAMFVVFAVPGYACAVWKMDRIGHRKLQTIGFAVLAVAFLSLAAVPELTRAVGPFLVVLGVSYFFVEFGPNTTTFVLPSELFPTELRTTGHGFAAGIGKLGAFAGVFLVPQLEGHIGLRGMLLVAGCAAVAGIAVTSALPEPSGLTLAPVAIPAETESAVAVPLVVPVDRVVRP